MNRHFKFIALICEQMERTANQKGYVTAGWINLIYFVSKIAQKESDATIAEAIAKADLSEVQMSNARHMWATASGMTVAAAKVETPTSKPVETRS